MDRRISILCCLCLVGLLAACGDRGLTEYRLSGPTMGTRFSVAVVTATGFDRDVLQSRISATLEDIDRRMSTYRADSELFVFNESGSTDWFPVTQSLCHAVEDALRFSELSGGAFDITVGPLVNLWGFGPDGIRTEPPDAESIDEARSMTGWQKLHADCAQPAIRKDQGGLRIDLSGYAKGLAADEIAAVLDDSGIVNYLVEIGGELRARGHNSSRDNWRIAIESPDDPGSAIEKIIHVTDIGVATSGDYRNFFEHDGRRYSHTIDPRSGRPVLHDLASVTVLADSAARADAIATALMVLGPEDGAAFAEREHVAAYFLVRTAGKVKEMTSSRFRALTQR